MDDARRDGRFEILEVAATGAYGTVCRARLFQQGAEPRIVAVKAMHGSHVGTASVVHRSRDEARVLMRLEHDHIVRVEQLVHIDRRPVLVMEWVEGATLRELGASRGAPFPTPVAIEIVRCAAEALHYAFRAPVGLDGEPIRVVHRDIKPANVLLSADGVVKVVDFGTAHGAFDEREASTVSTLMGSMGYIAPERLDNAPDTPAVDVYALGILLVELLTGECPTLSRNPATHDVGLAHHLAALSPADLTDHPRTRRALIELIARMAGVDRELRPSYPQLLAALQQLLAGLPEPDLPAFAAAHVPAARLLQPALPLHEHPEGRELEFLQGPWDAHTPPSAEDRASSHVDAQIAAALEQPDWPARRGDLLWLLAVHPTWTARPFIALLDRAASAPRWRFWGRPTPTEIVAALEILRYRPCGEAQRVAAVFARARRRAVRNAAISLQRACEESDQVHRREARV